jgi:mycofactocin precursor
MNDQHVEIKEELQAGTIEQQNEKAASDIFATKEIEIEEVAIDGICGVY